MSWKLHFFYVPRRPSLHLQTCYLCSQWRKCQGQLTPPSDMSVCCPTCLGHVREAMEVATGGQHLGVAGRTQEWLQEPLQLSMCLIIPLACVHECTHVCEAVRMKPVSSYTYQAGTLPLSHYPCEPHSQYPTGLLRTSQPGALWEESVRETPAQHFPISGERGVKNTEDGETWNCKQC